MTFACFFASTDFTASAGTFNAFAFPGLNSSSMFRGVSVLTMLDGLTAITLADTYGVFLLFLTTVLVFLNLADILAGSLSWSLAWSESMAWKGPSVLARLTKVKWWPLLDFDRLCWRTALWKLLIWSF